jgi:hypothetical protein
MEDTALMSNRADPSPWLDPTPLPRYALTMDIGDVCQLSALGHSRSPKTKWRTAVVMSRIGKSYRVLPEGRKEPIRMHQSYLEAIPLEEQTSTR